jgi:hypothetical protein
MRYSKLSGVKAQTDYYQAMEKITGIMERGRTTDVPPTRNYFLVGAVRRKPLM